MKKKILALCLCLLFSMALVAGCSSQPAQTSPANTLPSTETKEFADQAFLKDVIANVEARNLLVDSSPESLTQTELIDYYTKYLQAEEPTKEYANKDFEDAGLKEKALQYIDQLNKQAEALQYAKNGDMDTFQLKWDESSAQRAAILVELVDKYSLPFKYIDEFREQAQSVLSPQKADIAGLIVEITGCQKATTFDNKDAIKVNVAMTNNSKENVSFSRNIKVTAFQNNVGLVEGNEGDEVSGRLREIAPGGSFTAAYLFKLDDLTSPVTITAGSSTPTIVDDDDQAILIFELQ